MLFAFSVSSFSLSSSAQADDPVVDEVGLLALARDVSDYWVPAFAGMTRKASALLIRLDAGVADHLAPLRRLFGDERAEVRRRAAFEDDADIAEPFFDLLVGERG